MDVMTLGKPVTCFGCRNTRDQQFPIPLSCSIFKSAHPEKRARAIVEAVANYNDPKVLAKVSEDLGEAMVGINCEDMTVQSKLSDAMQRVCLGGRALRKGRTPCLREEIA